MESQYEIIKRMNSERIRDDGTVEDHEIETFYLQCESFAQADGYIVLVGDDGGVDFETRLLNSSLEKLGWSKTNPLIAAAPELLEACKKAIHFFDYEIPINAGEELNRILMELKTAISKAEAKP